MNNQEFNRLFGLWKDKKSSDIKDIGPQRSKDCLYFTELEAYAKKGSEALTNTKKQHIQSCAYCQKMIAKFEEMIQEEKQVITICQRLAQAFENLLNTLALPFKALPKLTPALMPALAVILILIIFTPLFYPALELKEYSFEFTPPAIKTRGLTSAPEMTIRGRKFRIAKVVTTTDCYVYLFAIEKEKINFLAWEKIAGKVKNTLPKKGWLQGEGKLTLLLTKNPLKDISSAGEIIIKNYNKDKKEILEALRKELRRKDMSFYAINPP